MKISSLVFFVVFALHINSAWGWGAYAHQQINVEAVQLFYGSLPGNNMAACLHTNQELMQRLAITPDYDWKVVGTAPTDGPSVKARQISDGYEHPLHFFEADAFEGNPDNFVNLPSGDFQSVLSQYQARVKDRHSAIAIVDPSKAIKDLNNITVEDVTVHGTAPWRIMQMYNLAVNILKNNKSDPDKFPLEQAFVYLGAMGHYVGDMSQPLHASLNYDGQYNPPQKPSKAIGLHAGFETEMFNLLNGKNDIEDKTEFTFPNFDLTKDLVHQSATDTLEIEPLTPLQSAQIMSHVFSMIAAGYWAIQSMVTHFADEVVNNPSRGTATSKDSTVQAKAEPSPTRIRKRAKKPMRVPSTDTPSLTPLQYAQTRMGAASALLARLWLSAEHDAGNPDISDCKVIPFNRADAIKFYQIPDYLPEGHQKVPKGASNEPASSSPSTNAIRAFSKDLL